MTPEINQRLPPHDREAERSVLGAMLRDNSVIAELMHVIRAGSFYVYAHQLLFDCIVELVIVRSVVCDAVTLANLIQEREVVADVGGYEYIVEIFEAATTHALEHAQIIRGHAIKRALVKVGHEIQELGFTPGSDWQHALDEAEAKLFAISGKVRTTEIVPFAIGVDEMLARMDARKSTGRDRLLMTNIRSVDRIADGFDEGNLITIGARTGIGKTVFALNLAFNMAEEGNPILFISLEQSRVELAERVVSSRSNVEAWRIRKAEILPTQEEDFFNAVTEVKKAKVFITDSPGLTVMNISAAIRQKAHKDGVRCVFVDYLQLIVAEDNRAKRHEQIGLMTQTLKNVARTTGVRIFVLAQINRESEKGADTSPKIHQLRESGSIESDSDVVLLLHRPDKTSSDMDVIVAKNRHGLEGTAKVHFDRNRLKIMDKV